MSYAGRCPVCEAPYYAGALECEAGHELGRRAGPDAPPSYEELVRFAREITHNYANVNIGHEAFRVKAYERALEVLGLDE